MKKLMLLICCAMAVAIAGCEDDNANQGHEQRLVDQTQVKSRLVPFEDVDTAVHSEAMTAMATIAQRVNFMAAQTSDKQALYRSLAGPLNASKCEKLGISESDLQGSFYKASDYTIVIVGNEMTISAAEIGSRGRVEQQKYRVP